MTNKLFYGDNLDVLREHVASDSVDLIYLDPPFNSNANYNILFKSKTGDSADAQIEAFEDTWHWNDTAEEAFDQVIRSGNTNAAELLRAFRSFLGENDMMAYLAMMAIRLIELHRVLKPTGSLYGTLAVTLVQAMNSPPAGLSPIQAMIGSLQTAGWPDDERFRHQWLRTRFYKWFRLARVLTILQAIEQEMQRKAVKSEKLLVDVNALTIEHIMPQTWQTNWPLPEGGNALDRDARVQNIGNLTLVTDRLNPALSNASWTGTRNSKRDQLAAHSKLEMNKLLLAQAGDSWTDEMIADRADKLFEVARTIWPSPTALGQQSPSETE